MPRLFIDALQYAQATLDPGTCQMWVCDLFWLGTIRGSLDLRHWSRQEARWVRADAQLDQLQRDQLCVKFNCNDLPSEAFLSGGQAWTLARTDVAAPDDFWHGASQGLWFVWVNLHRDLLALTNQPMSAWDTWRDSTTRSKILGDADTVSGDHLARTMEAIERAVDGITKLQEMAAKYLIPPWQN